MIKKIKNVLFCVLCFGFIAVVNAQTYEEKEITSLRDMYTKHFQNSDGTITAASYAYPIHYQDEQGNWQDIDNSLVSGFNLESNGPKKSSSHYFTLKNNPYIGVNFNKVAHENNLIQVDINGHNISWGIIGVNSSSASIIDSTTNEKYSLVNAVSGVSYENIFNNIDLLYYVTASNLKEEFYIKEQTDITELIYYIETDLHAFKTVHNLVILQDDNGDNVMTFQNPYMYDSAEKSKMTYNTTVEIEEIESGYKLIYKLDKEWLESSDRVYPIVIDPYVTNNKSQTNILDTYVHTGDASNHNHVNEDRLWVGKVNGTSRAFMNWASLPKINGTITNAAFDFNYFKGTSSWGKLQIYKVNSAWDSYTLTWDKHTSLGYQLLHDNLEPTLRNGYYNFFFDVTNIVKGWYNNTIGKNGFMVRYKDENYNDFNTIVSSDGSAGSDFWPTLKIWYDGPTSNTPASMNWSYPLQDTAYNALCTFYSTSHPGIDICTWGSKGQPSINGKPILAAQSGTVVSAFYDSSGGYMISIESDDYLNGNKVIYNYMHMQSAALVTTGRVKKGQIIGYVGNTGNSTGPHLHFETFAPNNFNRNSVGAKNYPGQTIDPTSFYPYVPFG